MRDKRGVLHGSTEHGPRQWQRRRQRRWSEAGAAGASWRGTVAWRGVWCGVVCGVVCGVWCVVW